MGFYNTGYVRANSDRFLVISTCFVENESLLCNIVLIHVKKSIICVHVTIAPVGLHWKPLTICLGICSPSFKPFLSLLESRRPQCRVKHLMICLEIFNSPSNHATSVKEFANSHYRTTPYWNTHPNS